MVSPARHIWRQSAWIWAALFAALATPWLTAEKLHVRFEHLSNNDGLSQSVVNDVVQDSFGFMWFATQDGLNRFDGYRFKVFKHDPDDATSISANWVHVLFEDSRGNLWVGSSAGLDRYDAAQERFVRFAHDPASPTSLPNDQVFDITEDANGILWIGTGGGLASVNPSDMNFNHFKHDPEDPFSLSKNQVRSVFVDESGLLWVGCIGGGLNRFDPQDNRFYRYRAAPGQVNQLQHDDVVHIKEGPKGDLWVATDGGGLHRFRRKMNNFEVFRHNPDNPGSVGADRIWDFDWDDSGVMWVATYSGGLSRGASSPGVFKTFRNHIGMPDSLSENLVSCVAVSDEGLIWAGTYGGGLNIVDPRKQSFGHYRREADDPESLNCLSTSSLLEDRLGRLWMVCDGSGLNMFDRDEDRFINFPQTEDRLNVLEEGLDGSIWIGTDGRGLLRFDPEQGTVESLGRKGGLNDDIILDLTVARDGRLWVATQEGGVSVRNMQTGQYTTWRANPADVNALAHDRVWVVIEGRGENMWMGTFDGLNYMDLNSGRFKTWRRDPDTAGSLCDSLVVSLLQDRDGFLWAGTSGGLAKMISPDGLFRNYHEKDGLPNETIYAMIEDDAGFIWMSTNMGLSRLDPRAETFINFDRDDGIQDNEFNNNVFAKLKTGELAFGGINGFNLFDPNNVNLSGVAPDSQITDFRLFNRSVSARTVQPDSPLEKAAFLVDALTLTHLDYVFSFEFSAMTMIGRDSMTYAYKMEGLDREWLYTDATQRLATYTNLDPGSYRFMVKSRNKFGVWDEQGDAIVLDILPPPWQSWWAYSIYTLTILGLVFGFLVSQRRKLEEKEALVNRLRQVDTMKDDFLANTSHELRTPLNGIIGLAESLSEGVAGPISTKARADLTLIVSSANRLAGLVDDILDFSKMKNDQLELQRHPVDLCALADIVLTLSRPLLDGKDLILTNRMDASLPLVFADENRVQQILHNLVGNAVKFTEFGSVTLSGEVRDGHVVCHVTDTGIGIPAQKLDQIFDSFEQVDASTSRIYGGTGLGLAVSRQLVRLHGGDIEVNSTLDKGSIFSFSLPIAGESRAPLAVKRRSGPVAAPADMLEATPVAVAAEGVGGRILVVDDEPVNRQVLFNFLAPVGYSLESAANGPDAVKRVLEDEQGFDLVLLDVMMPRMSGFEVAEVLRETCPIQDLPIIFLTAKNRVSDLMEGFAAGANDYLAKPIERGELLTRVKTHLQLLEFHRDLERKVTERTAELRDKNQELGARYRELETLDNIVNAINREVEFKKVLQALLAQGKILFPAVEKSSFLFLDRHTRKFAFEAVDGYNLEKLSGAQITQRRMYTFYGRNVTTLADGVYRSAPREDAPPFEELKEVADFKDRITLTIPFRGKPAAFLVFDSVSQPMDFGEAEIQTLKRFRHHAMTAVSKAKTFKDLMDTQKKLVETAHTAGMAEIATTVLHNMGNTLSSVKTSIHVFREQCENRQWLLRLERMAKVLEDHQGDLQAFFAPGGRGEGLPKLMSLIVARLGRQIETLTNESVRMDEQVSHIAAVLQEQHKHAKTEGNLSTPTDLNRMVTESLAANEYLFKGLNLQIEKQLGDIPKVLIQRSKLEHGLFYLLKNAWEAIEVSGAPENGVIQLHTRRFEDRVALEIRDNGVGIAPENLPRLFQHGFTTKAAHHGFGLHYCANAMRDMSGSIELDSAGMGQGAVVRLWFPLPKA